MRAASAAPRTISASTGDGNPELSQTRTHGLVNQITGITGGGWTTPSYDLAGNAIVVPRPRDLGNPLLCVYDAWNRLVEVTVGTTTIQRNSSTAAPKDVAPHPHYVGSSRYIDAPILRDQNSDNGDQCDDQRVRMAGTSTFSCRLQVWPLLLALACSGCVGPRTGGREEHMPDLARLYARHAEAVRQQLAAGRSWVQYDEQVISELAAQVSQNKSFFRKAVEDEFFLAESVLVRSDMYSEHRKLFEAGSEDASARKQAWLRLLGDTRQ